MVEIDQVRNLVYAVLVLQILCLYWMKTKRDAREGLYPNLHPADIHGSRTSGSRLRHQVLSTDVYAGQNEELKDPQTGHNGNTRDGMIDRFSENVLNELIADEEAQEQSWL